ncbi:MAG: hypothetical protein GXY87_02840 [Tissierellia bacterium]|nr:hypothetical protein [Tissierellia bacterium]
MWIIFGLAAILSAFAGLYYLSKNKDGIIYSFISISLTALTVTAFYSDGASRVLSKDWSGLMDIMPSMSKALWVLVILSILINSIVYVRQYRKR